MTTAQHADPAQWVVIRREFFRREVLTVAPALLGCVIAHETGDGLVAAKITEVEAYRGESDPASHAFRGQTARNAVMFGEPGHAYVYFTYGMHFCVNLVCQPPGVAAAVLLRAGRVIAGVELATVRRTAPGRRLAERDLARGPGRLCKALGITREQDGADVCDPASPLRIRWPDQPVKQDISQGPRIGISVATEFPWRFWLTGDPTVSVYRPYTPRRRPKPVSAGQGSDGTIPL